MTYLLKESYKELVSLISDYQIRHTYNEEI